jgi:hypothetical protein
MNEGQDLQRVRRISAILKAKRDLAKGSLARKRTRYTELRARSELALSSLEILDISQRLVAEAAFRQAMTNKTTQDVMQDDIVVLMKQFERCEHKLAAWEERYQRCLIEHRKADLERETSRIVENFVVAVSYK